MRQSQQKMALDYCRSRKVVPSLIELQRITDLFVEMCLRPQDDDLKTRITNLDKWLDKKCVEQNISQEIDGILL